MSLILILCVLALSVIEHITHFAQLLPWNLPIHTIPIIFQCKTKKSFRFDMQMSNHNIPWHMYTYIYEASYTFSNIHFWFIRWINHHRKVSWWNGWCDNIFQNKYYRRQQVTFCVNYFTIFIDRCSLVMQYSCLCVLYNRCSSYISSTDKISRSGV